MYHNRHHNYFCSVCRSTLFCWQWAIQLFTISPSTSKAQNFPFSKQYPGTRLKFEGCLSHSKTMISGGHPGTECWDTLGGPHLSWGQEGSDSLHGEGDEKDDIDDNNDNDDDFSGWVSSHPLGTSEHKPKQKRDGNDRRPVRQERRPSRQGRGLGRQGGGFEGEVGREWYGGVGEWCDRGVGAFSWLREAWVGAKCKKGRFVKINQQNFISRQTCGPGWFYTETASSVWSRSVSVGLSEYLIEGVSQGRCVRGILGYICCSWLQLQLSPFKCIYFPHENGSIKLSKNTHKFLYGC